MKKTALPTLALLTVLAPAAAQALTQLPADHVDFGIGFHDDELELHWHDEDSDTEYAPNEAFVFIPLSSTFTNPGGYGFTGTTAGGTVYLAPAVETPGVIFLGIGTEEIPAGTFVGDVVTLILVNKVGPGEFSLWKESFGGPVVSLSTVSGSQLFNFDVATGQHAHFNWGFSAPGLYTLEFMVNGTLADGLNTNIGDTATFTFAVGTPIPEPSSFAALAGLAALGLSASRRRRRA